MSSSKSSSTLKKGQACTCCRRRKTRCDGARPICTQCASNGRELDCEYSDGLAPTRTEILQEYLARLQNRVQTLEASHARRALSSGGPRQPNYPSLNFQPPSRWWLLEAPPPQVGRLLFDIFMRHEHQLGWGLNNDRISIAMASAPSQSSYPHPALANAIFLWGARLSHTNSLSTPDIEQTILTRATGYLQTQQAAAQSVRRGLEAIQAGILIATYLFAVGGRTLEMDYHVNAAVSLARAYGMHRLTPQPGSDSIEEGERISVFWKVFCLDRLWAIANGKPAAMQLQGDSRFVITTPWPNSPEEYAQGNVAYSITGMAEPLRQFLEEEGNSTSGFSYPALAVKASLLCERSFHLASRPTSNDEIRLADCTIFAFVSSLAPLDGNAPAMRKASFIAIHAIAYLAFIRLHESNAPKDAGAYHRCVQAARYISMLPGHLSQDEFTELSPFTMPCFVISSKVIMHEISRVRTLPPNAQGGNEASPNILIEELNRMMNCLEELSEIFPVIESQIDTLSDMRDNLEI